MYYLFKLVNGASRLRCAIQSKQTKWPYVGSVATGPDRMCIVDWFACCCHGNINVNLVLDPGSDHVLQQHCPAILMHVWQRLFECCTSFTATYTSTQRGCCTSFTATSTSTQRGCCKPPYRPILSDPSPHLGLASATFPSKVWFIHNSGRCPCPDTWMELL